MFSSVVLLVNTFYYHFSGNTYFPENGLLVALVLTISKLGLLIAVDKDCQLQKAGTELIYFFGVMALIALASNAIQLTPFSPIDKYIVRFESHFNLHLTILMEWTNTHILLKAILIRIYDTLPWQMCMIPLFLIATGRFALMRAYYFLLLFTTLIGFGFYYFFPTTAPASVLNHSLFSEGQLATGLKFYEIHHYLNPSTNDGGLIALPSFHVIWAILCVYLVKDWPVLFASLATVNSLLILSCVLLGWHFPTDALTGMIVAGISFLALNLSATVSIQMIHGEITSSIHSGSSKRKYL
jgi:hypothetical protein